MTLTRRKTLGLIGGGTIFAVTAAMGAFMGTRTPHDALQPWGNAGMYSDPRMNALSYALLAPNPHNRQPWLAQLSGKDMVILFRDKAKDLPVTDPFARQLTIGMGCFIELMEMAAAEQGYGVDTMLYPKGEEGPVAVCTFKQNAGRADPLFAHVLNRRSHKDAFKDRAVSQANAKILSKYAKIVTKGNERSQLRDIVTKAWGIEVSKPDAWKESIDLLRIGKSEINANPDGIDVGGPLFDTLTLLGLMTREAVLDINHPGSREVIDATMEVMQSAPSFAIMTSETNTRMDQIITGRAWLRLNLETAVAGMALRPISQALQEYSEMSEVYRDVHQLYAPDGGTVQMLGVLGYGETISRTPRWPLEAKLLNV